MRERRAEWLVFLALGLMWGSSYLFIKIAVDDFGTFTLVALRLAVGAALLWTAVAATRQRLPADPQLYGHLLVMAVVNIAIPFLLITWAEQSVDSALAAILTSVVPLLVIVLAPLLIHDEPMRLNAIAGLAVGFAGVIVLTGREIAPGGADPIGAPADQAAILALLGSSLSYALGAIYTRRNVRGVPPMIPAVFQVTFAMLLTGVIAIAFESPWDVRPDLSAVAAIVWLGLLGSGLAYLAFFRLLASWGATRTSAVAYLLPVVGIALGALVLGEPIDGPIVIGTGLVLSGIAVANGWEGRALRIGRRAASEKAA